jgi:hypothetical protein
MSALIDGPPWTGFLDEDHARECWHATRHHWDEGTFAHWRWERGLPETQALKRLERERGGVGAAAREHWPR